MLSWYALIQQQSNKRRPVVAYKGGHYEKDLLSVLHIPHCNLETWGCPKIEEVATSFPEV